MPNAIWTYWKSNPKTPLFFFFRSFICAQKKVRNRRRRPLHAKMKEIAISYAHQMTSMLYKFSLCRHTKLNHYVVISLILGAHRCHQSRAYETTTKKKRAFPMWVCESGTRQATSWPVKLWVTIYHLLGFTCFISINDKNCCDAVRNDAGHHREIVFSAIHWQKKKKQTHNWYKLDFWFKLT